LVHTILVKVKWLQTLEDAPLDPQKLKHNISDVLLICVLIDM